MEGPVWRCALVVVLCVLGSQATTVKPVATTPAPCKSGEHGSGEPNCQPCGHCLGAPCDTSSGRCAKCEPGYDFSGDNTCKTACTPGTYGGGSTSCTTCGKCQRGVHCNTISGACPAAVCAAGYLPGSGNKCITVCTSRTYGQNCGSTCGQCKGNAQCDHVSGACPALCAAGYEPGTGTLCKTACSDGRWGENCVKSCGNFCTQQPCAKDTGHCPNNGDCQAGYVTPLCTAKCSAGKYGKHCTESCNFCLAGNSSCDHVTGNCDRCVDNREPPLCKDCLPGHWGHTCGQLCGQCGGSGRCHPETGVCESPVCLKGWNSRMCDLKCSEGWYGVNCSNQCHNCLNDSPCRHDNGVCELGCQDDFEGVLCNKEKQNLTGPIAGGLMGAGALIAIPIIVFVVLWYLKQRKKKQPEPLQRDFNTLADVHSVKRQDSIESVLAGNENISSQRASKIYQNIDAPAHTNPASNYDHVDHQARVEDGHTYDSHPSTPRPHGSAPEESSDNVYQNTGKPASSAPKPKVALKPPKKKKGRTQDETNNVYGNV